MTVSDFSTQGPILGLLPDLKQTSGHTAALGKLIPLCVRRPHELTRPASCTDVSPAMATLRGLDPGHFALLGAVESLSRGQADLPPLGLLLAAVIIALFLSFFTSNFEGARSFPLASPSLFRVHAPS